MSECLHPTLEPAASYQKGCRCADCRAGNAARVRRWRRRNPLPRKVPKGVNGKTKFVSSCPRCGAAVLMPLGFDATEEFADLCYDCERVMHPRNGECENPRRAATRSYWMGCRCDYCVAVNAAYHRRQYLRSR